MIIILEILLFGLHLVRCQEGDGYTDENRPYKFGFNIEGYQHRYEEKNEKGIIMGEYGFITADGVYHLTVYATDENGNFKILKMKNIKIGLPTEKPMTSIPGVAGDKPQKINGINKQPEQMKLDGKPGCGGCLLPTTKPPEKESSKVKPIRGSEDQNGHPAYPGTTQYPEKTHDLSNSKLENPGKDNKNKNEQFVNSNPSRPGSQDKLMNTEFPDKNSPINSLNSGVEKPGKTGNEVHSNDKFSSKPGLQAGEKLPESVLDLMKLFYKFNYTLTYHGHEEVGNRAGEKNGSYFFNGRDGYQRKVNYTANEFGYQPNITLVKIGQDETPVEGSEKELTKLLGNEFIWYYQ